MASKIIDTVYNTFQSYLFKGKIWISMIDHKDKYNPNDDFYRNIKHFQHYLYCYSMYYNNLKYNKNYSISEKEQKLSDIYEIRNEILRFNKIDSDYVNQSFMIRLKDNKIYYDSLKNKYIDEDEYETRKYIILLEDSKIYEINKLMIDIKNLINITDKNYDFIKQKIIYKEKFEDMPKDYNHFLMFNRGHLDLYKVYISKIFKLIELKRKYYEILEKKNKISRSYLRLFFKNKKDKYDYTYYKNNKYIYYVMNNLFLLNDDVKELFILEQKNIEYKNELEKIRKEIYYMEEKDITHLLANICRYSVTYKEDLNKLLEYIEIPISMHVDINSNYMKLLHKSFKLKYSILSFKNENNNILKIQEYEEAREEVKKSFNTFIERSLSDGSISNKDDVISKCKTAIEKLSKIDKKFYVKKIDYDTLQFGDPPSIYYDYDESCR